MMIKYYASPLVFKEFSRALILNLEEYFFYSQWFCSYNYNHSNPSGIIPGVIILSTLCYRVLLYQNREDNPTHLFRGVRHYHVSKYIIYLGINDFGTRFGMEARVQITNGAMGIVPRLCTHDFLYQLFYLMPNRDAKSCNTKLCHDLFLISAESVQNVCACIGYAGTYLST